MSFSIVSVLHNYLIEHNKIHPEKPTHYYPTEASVQYIDSKNKTVTLGKCLRAAYFRCKGYESAPYSAKTQVIFDLGKATENFLIERLKEAGIYYGHAIKWQNIKYNISGELDLVVRDPSNKNELVGVEIKSIHGYNAEKEIFGNTRVAGKPKTNHLLQTAIYAWQFRHSIKYFKILYAMRDNGKMKEFNIEISLDTDKYDKPVHIININNNPIKAFSIESILARYKELNIALKTNMPPAREYSLKWDTDTIKDMWANKKISKSKYQKWEKCKSKSNNDWPGDWQCSYCLYKDLCWNKNGEPKDVILSEEIPLIEDFAKGKE